MSTRLTLAITTYERPDALAAVLTTVARQTSPPDELIVADDGSGPATREVCEGYSATTPLLVQYVRQDHDGFRLARLRNLAIARASHPYIVFVDGDMLLHPRFIDDHRRFARRGYFTQGVRIPIPPQPTTSILEGDVTLPPPSSIGWRRRAYASHAPHLSSAMRSLANTFIAIKGCNQAFWREDLVAVNGFNEDFVGWGPEDKEIAARLQRHGTRRQTLLFGGIAFHLHHPPAGRERRAANERLLADTRTRRLARCEHGLEAHLRVL